MEDFTLHSNIFEESIVNSEYANVICLFKPGVEGLGVGFKNPAFLKTSEDLLRNAEFYIINFEIKEAPDW